MAEGIQWQVGIVETGATWDAYATLPAAEDGAKAVMKATGEVVGVWCERDAERSLCELWCDGRCFVYAKGSG